MKKKIPLLQRDISWLRFNFRVLQEAMNPDVPLFERIKFLAIYSSNLDEFYAIRVANARNLVKTGRKTIKELDFDPKDLLKQIRNIVANHHKHFSKTLNHEIIPQLKSHGIFLLKPEELNLTQRKFIDNYFNTELIPFAQPVLLADQLVKPFLQDSELYLAISLKNKSKKTNDIQYAIVKIPSDYLPRFISLPSKADRHDLILLDDIVRYSLKYIFPGFEIIGSYSMKITRDAELYIDDEFKGNLLEKIRKSLVKRNIGPASRFVYDRSMPLNMLEYFVNLFGIEPDDMIQEGKMHNNFDWFKFPDFGMKELKYKSMKQMLYPALTSGNLFEEIKNKDHIIYTPYESYEPVIRFFEEAARDPDVTHIRITQYRVANESRIMHALSEAVKNGKEVKVFIEVKARFDEAANLKWGEWLSAAGVKVQYSFPGLKVHSKMALVTRIENKKSVRYAYLSTGNFHEDTAKVYCDFGLFTADRRLTGEVHQLFRFLDDPSLTDIHFQHLLVGQFNLREKLNEMIDFEIKEAKSGKPASIMLKMNSLEDKQMIEKLYEADQAGVEIRLIIRGINCLLPGLQKFSKNIKAISIVDRYLEHARVFRFHAEGKNLVFLSSADWMVRNLSYRIETVFPLLQDDTKEFVCKIMELQFADNTKSRKLDGLTDSVMIKNGKSPFNSQLQTYKLIKNLKGIKKIKKNLLKSE
ncbi:MAG TPA: polyphosphate kinase 1 [Saprospiraceae bacterium]|nr:polyphosphate kinase 1 [Saprospiraceae bacterium]HMZ73652.1 polyphosphate kinase 1 [Saprospiraceae bacterium]HND17112.1 polyphosphate kinase 1 [Saprospiraceae bacterium]HNE66092.1 polyphosphate kinase 1 [Saprospiraceae bacterium]HNG06403.1 polyphosphate kinase 1 [Saprospiraceae bacterium]